MTICPSCRSAVPDEAIVGIDATAYRCPSCERFVLDGRVQPRNVELAHDPQPIKPGELRHLYPRCE